MTPETLQLVVVSTNTVTLLAGSFVVLLAFRAQRRTGARALRVLTEGLGCITAGTLLGGVLHQSGAASLLVGVAAQSLFVAVGFCLLAWSLVLTHDVDTDRHPRTS